MKTGHEALKPRRRASKKCPSSWTKISSDEPDRELPAPEQRVAADRDEDRRELGDANPNLMIRPTATTIGAQILRAQRPPGRLRVDRPVVALGDLGLEAHLRDDRPGGRRPRPRAPRRCSRRGSSPRCRRRRSRCCGRSRRAPCRRPSRRASRGRAGLTLWLRPMPSSAITSAPAPASSTSSRSMSAARPPSIEVTRPPSKRSVTGSSTRPSTVYGTVRSATRTPSAPSLCGATKISPPG